MVDCSESNKNDYNFMRYAGWDESNPSIKLLYSQETVAMISKKITELTKGLDKYNRNLIVPDEQICQVIDGVYIRYFPNPGDIFTRLNIDSKASPLIFQNIVDQVIEIITSDLRNEYGMIENNSKLTAWVQVLGDFNPNGLRAHPIIKTKEKRTATMQFFQNY